MSVYYYPTENETSTTLTIILSSGLGGRAHFWQPQIAALTPYFNVLTYDHEGTSINDDALPEGYTIQDMAKQLKDIVTLYKIKQCHFIGHALGAFIGIELAYLMPNLIQKMIIINAWDQLDAHTIKCFQTRETLLRDSGASSYIAAQALFLYPPQWISDHIGELIQQEQEMVKHFPDTENVIRRLSALQSYQPIQHIDCLNMPCLVIVNKDDFLVPWQRSKAFYEHLQDATLIMINEGGHASTMTQTDQINRYLIQFLTSVKEAELNI